MLTDKTQRTMSRLINTQNYCNSSYNYLFEKRLNSIDAVLLHFPKMYNITAAVVHEEGDGNGA